MKTILFALSGLIPLMAQSLMVMAPPASAPGDTISVDIVLQFPHGGEPAAVQWEFDFPAGPHGFRSQEPKAGPVATAASKFLACSGKWKKAASIYSYRCILAGGRKPIPSGIVGVIQLTIPATAKTGVYVLGFEKAKAVNAAAAAMPLKLVPGKVTVRANSSNR